MNNEIEVSVIEGEIINDRVIRDGMVAIIVSPGYGAGWSTWAHDLPNSVFAPDVVKWIENGKKGDTKFAEKYGYTGGLVDAEIVWIPIGTYFRINEYDGSESLEILSERYYTLA